MFVPAWPVLHPSQLVGPARGAAPPFPLSVPEALRFYVARGAIYHLFRALGGGVVLVPAYHHGNEVRALRAAGADVRFYPVNRRLEVDLDLLDQLCRPPVRALFAIHYLGWPQPAARLAAMCRERGILLVEDCALALLSEPGGRPLGTFGDFAVFCLYKTLPVPNGGLLVARRPLPAALRALPLPACDRASLAGRSAELMLSGLRQRWSGLGAALCELKAAAGRGLTTLGVRRVPVGDEGFDVSQAGLGMSPLSWAIARRCDAAAIRARRRANYQLLLDRLAGRVAAVKETLEDGVCPLFFPLLVADKEDAMRRLAQKGIETVPFWNQGDPAAAGRVFPDVRFLREHVLELPIHQDVTPVQVEHMARQVLSLRVAIAA
jgi:dTDP-4-amino-4,6-dideoxygalactose transaminase